MRFLLLLFLCIPLAAQDTTCNAGDILWVSEGVNADTDIAAGGAEYNNAATPFGIQGAFDSENLCTGSIIRILDGANEYGPSSTSWNNRTDTTKKIVVAVDRDGAFTSHIRVEGWADSSTRCGTSGNQWTAACPVYLDFDRDNITGDDGFEFATTGDGYIFEWIGVKNTDAEGFAVSTGSANVQFHSVAVVNSTGAAIGGPQNSTSTWYLYDSYFSNVGTGGSAAILVSGFSPVIANNVIDCEPGGSPVTSQDGLYVPFNLNGPVIINNVFRNCDSGLWLDQADAARVIRNTFENHTNACIHTSNASVKTMAIMNVFTGCSNSILGGTNHYLLADNVYSAGTGQSNAGQVLNDVDDAQNNNGTTFSGATCVFTAATDESMASGCALSQSPPGGELASQDAIIPGISRKGLGTGGGGGGGGGGTVSYGAFQ